MGNLLTPMPGAYHGKGRDATDGRSGLVSRHWIFYGTTFQRLGLERSAAARAKERKDTNEDAEDGMAVGRAGMGGGIGRDRGRAAEVGI